MMIDDEDLLAKLQQAIRASRAVPPGFVQSARDVFAALLPPPDEPVPD
jgi:hypothetical protein